MNWQKKFIGNSIADENISIEDKIFLKPTLEQCQRTLGRLIEMVKKDRVALTTFSSLIFIWIGYRDHIGCNKLQEEDKGVNDEVYGIIANYLSGSNSAEKNFLIPPLAATLNLDLEEMERSVEMQTVCRMIIDHEELILEEEKIDLLKFLLRRNLLLDYIHKLIIPLAHSGNQVSLGVALSALIRIKNIDWCPTSVIFQSQQFPNYNTQFNQIINKVSDPDRRLYLRGILLSSVLTQNPTKENALEYVKSLPQILKYLELHQKEEFKDWLLFKAYADRIHKAPLRIICSKDEPLY